MLYWVFVLLVANLLALLGVAFYTLVERKLLAYAQSRRGPMMVGVSGLGQPFADGIKLLSKEAVFPHRANKLVFLMGPVLMLGTSLVFWVMSPIAFGGGLVFQWSVLLVICLSSAMVHGLLMVGWSSNSKYALLGAVRAMAQVISYEVVMLTLVVVPVVLLESGDIYNHHLKSGGIALSALLWPVFVVWCLCVMAESNRAPFDFVEGESELVSGFNVEYSGSLFAMIFLGEYVGLIFLCLFSSSLFLGSVFGGFVSAGVVVFQGCVLSCGVVWVRAGFPRFRYDLLMMVCWKSLLPVSIALLSYVLLF